MQRGGKRDCEGGPKPQPQPGIGDAGALLPGGSVGDGPRWDISNAVENSMLEASGAVHLMQKQLQEMFDATLHGDPFTDVALMCDGGEFRAHGCILVLNGFENALLSGMKVRSFFPITLLPCVTRAAALQEDRTRVIELPGTSARALRAWLEWMYLKRAGPCCLKVDARELFLLLDLHPLAGLREWLVQRGITKENLLAVIPFLNVDQGYKSDIKEAVCEIIMSEGIDFLSKQDLSGVVEATATTVVEAWLGNRTGRRALMRSATLQAHCFLDKYSVANPQAAKNGSLKRLAKNLDMSWLKEEDISKVRNTQHCF